MDNSNNVIDKEQISEINVKFALPKIKVENNFPKCEKPLTLIMKDFLLLTETEHNYSKDREDYIEKLLVDEKMRTIEKKRNRVINKSELNVISLGPSENIKLNITKSSNNDIINRLRCTWIRAGEQYECLVDTGASHAFLKEDQVNKIPKNLIINKRNYKSSMFTAGGNLKNNIKAKIIIICSFQLDNGDNITIPIEFLVATHLNGWNMILGEYYLRIILPKFK